MRELVWSNTFRRALKRTLKRNPHLKADLQKTLERLQADPFDPRLSTHKLKGKLAGTWSCSAGYDLRVIFEMISNDHGRDSLFLIEIGTHDEVY